MADSAQGRIEKLVYGGDGLARIDGQVLLVPFVLPGEEVRTEVRRLKAGVLRGGRPQLIEAAPERVVPPCEYFGTCGGCHYQHAPYAVQLVQKTAILRETLQRLGSVTYEAEVQVVSGEPWGYRNRVQLHFKDRKTGFHQAGSHELCAIDHCPISSPKLVEAIGTIAKAVRQPQWPTFLRSLELFTNESELQLVVMDTDRPVAARFFEWCSEILPEVAPGAVTYAAGQFQFRISRGSFFQVNRFLVEALVDEVLWGVGDAGAKVRRALDLYAGVGLFALPLANDFERVDAVERGGPAYRDLEFNSRQAGVNVDPFKGSAEEYLRGMDLPPDLLVADPPRSGLGPEITAELVRLTPERLVIVSCDPATLSRDLKVLLQQYQIERLTLVDLFPQTYHFETVAHLRRR